MDLNDIRERLDKVDVTIVDALAERQRLVHEVARWKAVDGAPLRDLPREEAVLTRVAARSREAGLDAFFVARLFREILSHAVRSQEATFLERSVQDQPENYTRMVIVARRPAAFDRSIPCKTSLMFATRHAEGTLVRCLNVLADHHLNMTKLESRPRPRNPWEYLFYVDVEGNVADPNVAEALRALAARASFLKVLGSYPARTGAEARQADPRP